MPTLNDPTLVPTSNYYPFVTMLSDRFEDVLRHVTKDDFFVKYVDTQPLIKNQDNPADHYRNLQKLKYFLSYSVAVLLHIQKVGSLHIWFEDEPMYAISIIYKNGTYSVGAHSDIEDYYRWDKIIEQIV